VPAAAAALSSQLKNIMDEPASSDLAAVGRRSVLVRGCVGLGTWFEPWLEPTAPASSEPAVGADPSSSLGRRSQRCEPAMKLPSEKISARRAPCGSSSLSALGRRPWTRNFPQIVRVQMPREQVVGMLRYHPPLALSG
jgi:hypothetical protein